MWTTRNVSDCCNNAVSGLFVLFALKLGKCEQPGKTHCSFALTHGNAVSVRIKYDDSVDTLFILPFFKILS